MAEDEFTDANDDRSLNRLGFTLWVIAAVIVGLTAIALRVSG